MWLLAAVALFAFMQTPGVAAAKADYETVVREGLLALKAGRLAEARNRLESAAEMRPDEPRLWVALAQTYVKAGEGELAKEAAAKAEALAPDHPAVLHGLAVYYAESGEWLAAAKREARFARSQPDDLAAALRAAQLYLRAERPAEAAALAEWALDQDNDARLYVVLAQARAAGGEPEAAVEPLREAVRLQPYEERYHFELARLLLRLQRFEAALEALDQGQEIFARSPRLELLRGIAYYAQRKFSKAVDSFLRSAKLGPGMEQPHVFLGQILNHAQHRLDEATARFAAFNKTHPENHLGYYLHAIALLAGMGPSPDPEISARAERLLRRSLELAPEHAPSHYELGGLLARKREYKKAAEHLEQAAELDPADSRIHYHLARVYLRLGEKDKAAAERKLHQKLVEEERQRMRRGVPLDTGAFSESVTE